VYICSYYQFHGGNTSNFKVHYVTYKKQQRSYSPSWETQLWDKKSSFLGELSALCKAHLRYLQEMSIYIVGIHEEGDETSVSFRQTEGRHISGRRILTLTAVTQRLTTEVADIS
jgi:hypothetical protein